ncbi:MAG: redoxin domain-containing protein [Prevotellaceae bacterium]|jgi:thioredoxin|nr:redoxin domain-containing protein [Prevotellaceae bacterium]
MRKLSLIIICAVFATVIFAQDNTQQPENYGKVTFLTFESFKQKIVPLKEGQNEWNYIGDKPCVIDFYASWCGPCRMLSPHLEKAAKEFAGEIYVYKIDTQQERQLAQIFNVTSIPMLLFCPIGKQPLMQRGYRDFETLKTEINQHLLGK